MRKDTNTEKDSRRGCARLRGILASLALLMLVNSELLSAQSNEAVFEQAGAYAGVFGGLGLTGNRLVDVDGFANWGNPGAVSNYNDTDFVGGVLAGKQFDLGNLPFRIEVDGTFGDASAKTNKLDPEGLDETAKAKFRWISTARAGIEQTFGRMKVFVSGGLAVAGVTNSVTDIDFSANSPPQVDPDDSFRSSSTKTGWVIGAGIEASLADAWTLRLEGSYLDFGQSTYPVNRSGNNRCGAGGPRRACPYKVENELGIVRLAITRRFNW